MNQIMPDPIASYHEKLSGRGDYRHELFPDRIRQRGKGIHGIFDVSHQLSNLDPVPDRWWLRNQNHFWLLFSLIIFEATMIGFALADSELQLLWGLVLVVGVIGGILLLQMPARIEYCYFKSRKTGDSLFTIGRSGPDIEHYDSFIEQLCQQIKLVEEVL